MIVLRVICLLVVLIFPSVGLAESGKERLRFAVANGYPPYQFVNEEGYPAGVDVDVIRLLGDRIGVEVVILQGAWDDMVRSLRQRSVDCVGGMEINEKRQRIFGFSTPYYSRKSVVFVKKDNKLIQSVDDLRGRIVAGDRHSYVENRLSDVGIKSHIRIKRVDSKDLAIQMLKNGTVEAVIAPMAVGYYLAGKHDVAVKIIFDSDPGSPVGIAVNKDDSELLDTIESGLHELREDGSLGKVLEKWHIR